MTYKSCAPKSYLALALNVYVQSWMVLNHHLTQSHRAHLLSGWRLYPSIAYLQMRRYSAKQAARRVKSTNTVTGPSPRGARAGGRRAARPARGSRCWSCWSCRRAPAPSARSCTRTARTVEEQTESVADSSHITSDHDDVEIKEEPAEVVEISSDEEKPKIEKDAADDGKTKGNVSNDTDKSKENQTVTKRVNDLIITVPQTKQTRKIKLNRNKATATVTNAGKDAEATVSTNNKTTDVIKEGTPSVNKVKQSAVATKQTTAKEDKLKKKIKKKKKDKDKYGSDHDEITLQLSDTEKMDLLEDLDRKNFDKLSSSSSEDSEDSSSESEDESQDNSDNKKTTKKIGIKISKNNEAVPKNTNKTPIENNMDCSEAKTDKNQSESNVNGNTEFSEKEQAVNNDDLLDIKDTNEIADIADRAQDNNKEAVDNSNTENNNINEEVLHNMSGVEDGHEKQSEKDIEMSSINDIPVVSEQSNTSDKIPNTVEDNAITAKEKTAKVNVIVEESNVEQVTATVAGQSQDRTIEKEQDSKEETKDLSEGELSERASSEVEAVELQPEVVCISDEETEKKNHKKKKKKEKKNKKEKKCKKTKSDFREDCDQNFFKETKDETDTDIVKIESVVRLDDGENDYDEVYEILELSDDSSCYEVEGTVLSKEPTAEEIEALSAKIDQIEREDVVTEEEIREHERKEKEKQEALTDENLENVSWKDRYLDSKKVKKVLSTSSIFNALRKKNRELKRKLEESKKKEEIREKEKELAPLDDSEDVNVEEGTIDHFNTLEGSTKYVDPINEIEEKEDTDNLIAMSEESLITREMKKDAKQLLKMYKRLLKYNDMTKQRDPNKKKKKKSKKKSKEISGVTNGTSGV
ncbi:unnamed protein product [Diatraea saccharalis]|uniref:Uncharacterized protein n=1 Tax=Diatraea saccharalis TaxID=40085 RepID=A0A9P0G393_9NEOP|nr:unnamed protein product [Diatraea saccharalis]